jgi:hypothetical protein
MSAHIKAFTEIMNIVDRCNPAGRTCSVDQMTKALLSIRELAFQEVTRAPQSEGERAHRELKKRNPALVKTDWCELTDVQRAKWDAKAVEVRQKAEAEFRQEGMGVLGKISTKPAKSE